MRRRMSLAKEANTTLQDSALLMLALTDRQSFLISRQLDGTMRTMKFEFSILQIAVAQNHLYG